MTKVVSSVVVNDRQVELVSDDWLDVVVGSVVVGGAHVSQHSVRPSVVEQLDCVQPSTLSPYLQPENVYTIENHCHIFRMFEINEIY